MYFVICFLFNLKGGLNEVNSPLFRLFGSCAGGCVGPRVESSWRQAGAGGAVTEERACLDQ